MNDPVAEALGRALRQHAEDAPADDGLLTGVRAGVRRRRRRRTTAAAVAVLAATAVPASVWLTSSTPRDTTPMAAPARPAESAAEAAWTTVSYRGVEVQVPAGWHVVIEPGCRPAEKSPDLAAAKASCDDEMDSLALSSTSRLVLDGRIAAYTTSAKERESYDELARQQRSTSGVLTKDLVLRGVLISAYSADADQLERVLKQIRRAPR